MWDSSISADQRSHSARRSAERFVAAVEAVAEEEFAGSGWRAGAGVEQSDGDFAAGERAVEHRNVADDQRDEAEAGAAFEHHEARERTGWSGMTSPRPSVKSVVPLT